MSKNHPITAFILQLLRAVFAALSVVLISRWMGAEGRGELSLILFAINMIMIANEFVGGSNLANLVATEPLNRLIPFSKIWALAVCILGCLIFYFISENLFRSVLAFGISLPLAWLTVQYNIYHGLQKVQTRNVLMLLLEFSRLLAVILVVYFIASHLQSSGATKETDYFAAGEKLDINTILVIYAFTVLGVFIISSGILWQRLIGSVKGSKVPLKSLITSGAWNQGGQLVQFLNYRLNLVLLTMFLGEKFNAGIYSNALLIADTIWIFGNSFASIAHMRMLQSGNPVFRADVTLRYAVIAIIGTAIGCIFILAIPNSIYVAIFGSDFESLKSTALWFIPSILALGASTLFSHYLHATNQFKTLLLANLSGLAVQVVLAIILIPVLKLQGACIAADAGFIIIFFVVFYTFKKQNPDAYLHGSFKWKTIWETLTKNS